LNFVDFPLRVVELNLRNRFRSENLEILSGLLSLNRGFYDCKDTAFPRDSRRIPSVFYILPASYSPPSTGKGYGFLLGQANKFERASFAREWGRGEGL
jgi:hypothetical protein